MSILVDKESRIIVQGITGREAVSFVADSLGYGAKIVGGVTPGKAGMDVHGVPVYNCVRDITGKERVDIAVISVPPAFVKDAAFEALQNGVPLIVVITERVARADVVQVLELARQRGARVIGPNTMGLISPGKSKAGSVGGPPQDARKAFVRGPVGIMSRSGGMTTEIANLLTQNRLGQSTAISVGGDPIIGSTFVELLPLFEADPETKAVVLFCEPGGSMEKPLTDYIKANGTRLPIVAFIAGRFADAMPGVRFGHAGSIVQGKQDTAAAKVELFREAGIAVAEEFSEIATILKERLGDGKHVY
ncbi:MAG: CoA-binding protein [Chloroflexi bacterium]|nr:CoA-binding protein [Chloroflexota bacterium]